MPGIKDNLEKRPEVQNLLGIYSSLSNQTSDKTKIEFEGKNFSFFKDKLSELLVEKIDPIARKSFQEIGCDYDQHGQSLFQNGLSCHR